MRLFTDLTLLSSEILCGTEMGGGARTGHALKDRKGKNVIIVTSTVGLRGLWGRRPDSVLEAGQEAGGDAEPRVQEVFFLRRLQARRVGVEAFCRTTGRSAPQSEEPPRTTNGFSPSRLETRVSKWFFTEFLSSSSSRPKLPTELP